MLTVRQIDRIEIVVRAIGQLHESRAVDVDLVKMKRLFVVWLEAEENFPSIVREIGPPEGTVQRRVGHKLGQRAGRRESLQNE